jgi:hypothetical protein
MITEVLIFSRKIKKLSDCTKTIKDMQDHEWVCTRGGCMTSRKAEIKSELPMLMSEHVKFLIK